jgi:hypothetical protein
LLLWTPSSFHVVISFYFNFFVCVLLLKAPLLDIICVHCNITTFPRNTYSVLYDSIDKHFFFVKMCHFWRLQIITLTSAPSDVRPYRTHKYYTKHLLMDAMQLWCEDLCCEANQICIKSCSHNWIHSYQVIMKIVLGSFLFSPLLNGEQYFLSLFDSFRKIGLILQQHHVWVNICWCNNNK